MKSLPASSTKIKSNFTELFKIVRIYDGSNLVHSVKAHNQRWILEDTFHSPHFIFPNENFTNLFPKKIMATPLLGPFTSFFTSLIWEERWYIVTSAYDKPIHFTSVLSFEIKFKLLC